MQLSEATPHRDKHLEDAIRLLESHSDFPRVQVRMRDCLEEAQGNAPSEARFFGTNARREFILQRYDIRAQAFLELVSVISMQNAYMVVLEHFVSVAWEEYTGAPPEVVRPTSDQTEKDFSSIKMRKALWAKAGYERLANSDQEQTSSPGDTVLESPAQADSNVTVGSTERRAAVDAYIEEGRQKTGKTITQADIWRAAGYKSRTTFERWLRNDPARPNKTADHRFTKILREKPHLKKI